MEDFTNNVVLGYLFGKTPYEGSVAIRQNFNGGETDYYLGIIIVKPSPRKMTTIGTTLTEL
ncbi:MAG: hypothetical protein IKB56_04420 [Clostridia bacterium]|nr:hypothetical protein [Clostridia bacterium]